MAVPKPVSILAGLVARVRAIALRALPLLIGGIALGTAVLVLLRTHHGAGVSGDSLVYISTAENLAHGRGLSQHGGMPLTIFPPGYPMMLAPFEWLGIGAREASRLLNALLFGSTVLMAGLWMGSVCRSVGIVVVATLAIAGSRTYHRVASSYLSEPLYVFLAISSLILLSELLRRSGDPASGRPPPCLKMLLASGLLAGLAASTRYIGVALVVSGTIVLLLACAQRKAAWTQRLLPAVLFGAAGSLPIGLVLARNLAADGTLTGDRSSHDTGRSFPEAAGDLLGLFGRMEYRVGTILVLSVVAAALGLRIRMPWRALAAARSTPFAAFAVVCSLAILFTQAWTREPPSPRYFLPVYVALLFVFVEAWGAVLRRSRDRDAPVPLIRQFSVVAVVLVCLVPLVGIGRHGLVSAHGVVRYGNLVDNLTDLRDSPMIDHLQQSDLDLAAGGRPVITNRKWAAFFLLGLQPLESIETSEAFSCREQLERLDRPRWVVWFANLDPGDTVEYCDIPALAADNPTLELQLEFADGAVYRLNPSA